MLFTDRIVPICVSLRRNKIPGQDHRKCILNCLAYKQDFSVLRSHSFINKLFSFLVMYLPTSQHHAYLHCMPAWLVRIFQTVRSWASICASSTDHPNPKLRRSLWMTILSTLFLVAHVSVFHELASRGAASLGSSRYPFLGDGQTTSICDFWWLLTAAVVWSEILCAFLRHVGTKQSAGSYAGIAYQRHLI